MTFYKLKVKVTDHYNIDNIYIDNDGEDDNTEAEPPYMSQHRTITSH